MPTKLPRLNVTVTEEQHAMLLELGALQQRSAASFLREMLDQATPMIAKALPIFRAAAKQTEIQSSELQGAVSEVLSSLDEHRDQFDLLRLLAGQHPGQDFVPEGGDADERTAANEVSEDRAAASPRGRRSSSR